MNSSWPAVPMSFITLLSFDSGAPSAATPKMDLQFAPSPWSYELNALSPASLPIIDSRVGSSSYPPTATLYFSCPGNLPRPSVVTLLLKKFEEAERLLKKFNPQDNHQKFSYLGIKSALYSNTNIEKYKKLIR